jgi:GWxTD domain-containing protein
VIFCFSGCKVNRSVSGKNVNFLYQSSQVEEKIEVDYKVYRQGNTLKLIWKLDPNSLGLKRTEDGLETLGFKFRFKVYHNYSQPLAIDSGFLVMKEIPRPRIGILTDTISLELPVKRKYLLDIECRDLNTIRVNQQYVDLNMTSGLTHSDVLLYSDQDAVLFSPYLEDESTYKMKVNTDKSTLYVRVYNREFQMAAAPFAIVNPKPFQFKPDMIFSIKKNNDGYFELPVDQTAFFQLTEDSTKYAGPTFYYFGEHYPKPRLVADLVYPLRYISTSDEYKALLAGDNIKRNVDNHWLKVGGGAERAKELIMAYYSRVELTNKLFPSYLEGWKTDRGMCYIVYGEPNAVYRSTSTETWVYGEEGIYNSLSLVFTRVSNPFTDSDFRLNRSNSLKASWYRSVEFWRQGRIINYK